jgi:hypothetical protein
LALGCESDFAARAGIREAGTPDETRIDQDVDNKLKVRFRMSIDDGAVFNVVDSDYRFRPRRICAKPEHELVRLLLWRREDAGVHDFLTRREIEEQGVRSLAWRLANPIAQYRSLSRVREQSV